jgi:hypothetical protein
MRCYEDAVQRKLAGLDVVIVALLVSCGEVFEGLIFGKL